MALKKYLLSCHRKGLTALVALAVTLFFTVGGTLAWLAASTAAVDNTFLPANVTCEVHEIFDGSAKSDVTVENTGNTDAFLRARIVVNWADESGNLYAAAPAEEADYTISLNTGGESGWFEAGGCYYYNDPVAPGARTPVLITSCVETPNSGAPAGCHLQVTVLAEAIQAKGGSNAGTPAVNLAWPDVEVVNGSLSANAGGAAG